MSIGIWQIILVLVLVLVLFGAGKLPRVMGDLGKGMHNFKDGLKGGEDDKDKENKDADIAEAAGEDGDKKDDKDKA
ncbi:MAG: twin-arginine translocase TatA/TatE family subunit [Pseudomonadota bacterium]|jgi:sec-independent protein translocase protein TatA|nr:twin-arginine translocase TatA/TatE family subunit [Pseudomonadota bacterium]QKK04900.1 MAG: twin-arginine translocase TatA/TatE family subunit [Pseudomonadota bacterium]